MNRNMTQSLRATLIVGSTALAACLVGCPGDLAANLTEEVSGNISVQFINNTDVRAVFSYGGYDAFDRNPPGPAQLQQLRVEAGQSSTVQTLVCRRNVAIGTQDFLTRILDVNADDVATFDADAFKEYVSFSSAPADSAAAGLPTDGTAEGDERRLGVDFSCGDLLIFTFNEDATAPGGFRVDFTVVPDIEADQ